MKRQQRIEALEYFDKHFLTIYHYHHTKKADELEFASENNIVSRAMFNYLYTGKLISWYGNKRESRTADLFMLNENGHERLRKLKDKHIYFKQKENEKRRN